MRVCAIIPARLGSTRLPNKPLISLGGKAMIVHVLDNAAASRYISDVYVATDHQSIVDVVEAAGGKAILTPEACPSGTDRIREALKSIPQTVDFVVNIQGDEPLLKATLIDEAIEALINNKEAVASTLASTDLSLEDYRDENRVKVILNNQSEAIYFSRSAIPFNRDSADKPKAAHLHIGLYVYRTNFLQKFADLPYSALEDYEKLEQLRIIENNYKIAVAKTSFKPIGVDVANDIQLVEERLKEEQT
jgi:3-deoxy-manno-octulosonate cytidylyltransferase (CMP-KDO synthetase)